MTSLKHRLGCACVVLICCCMLSAPAFSAPPQRSRTQQSSGKHYLIILLGFVFFLPEIVELDIADNETFSLQSDLFDQPAHGTYENGLVLMFAQGTTGKFYDIDFEEEIEIVYRFAGWPAGLRNFFILGIGSRVFTFADGLEIRETFIFQGPGV